MYIKRHLEEQVREASCYYPVVMVCGQRQVGKSTMLNHIREPERRYVTLDDGNARRLAETDPALFFDTYGYPLLIDEFQRVPSILLEMKKIVDRRALAGEDNSGMYWLTGSQKFRMMQGVSESLVGRTAVFDLSSLSAAEIEGRPAGIFRPDLASLRERMKYSVPKDIHRIYEDIFRGGMPRLHSSDLDRDRYYCMAARTAQELRYDEIAGVLGVSAPTVKAWVSILERSGVIYILRPYASNITKRLIKTPKMYFMDTGLAAYLCRWPTADTLEKGAMDGAFFETYVVTEIVKSCFNAGRPADLYYYRDIDKKEIDLLMIEGDKLYPIEIKKGKEPTHADRNFSVLQKFPMDIQPGLILCMSDDLIPYNRNAWYCPVSVL